MTLFERKLRVLFAEDNEMMAAPFVRVMEKAGYEVTYVQTGRLAQEALASPHANYDILLTDLYMPEMSGIELLQWVKKREFPLIAMVFSGFLDEESRRILEELEVDAVLSKPLRPQAVVMALEGVYLRLRV